MAYPIKVCVICGEEFELKPGKPGFVNRCPACSEEESDARSRPAEIRVPRLNESVHGLVGNADAVPAGTVK